MSWGIVASVGGSLIGGMMSSDAAGDAADTQAASADRATALQREMFDKQTELQEPFRQAGLAGQNRLLHLLGLTVPTTGTTGGTDAAAIRAQLLPQYTTRTQAPSTWTQLDEIMTEVPGAFTNTVDEAGLGAAIQQRMAQPAQSAQTPNNDPAFGSLMRDFGMSDFQADPGYAFRMSEGSKALERSAAARGGLLSGRAAKDTMRFGQDLGTQEYGNAFNRFQINRGNKLNPLMALSGVGQTATNQVANAAGNFGQGASQTIQGAGNARASGYVGQANSWNNAIGQGINNYQQNQMMSLLKQPTSYGSRSTINPYSGEFMGSLEF